MGCSTGCGLCRSGAFNIAIAVCGAGCAVPWCVRCVARACCCVCRGPCPPRLPAVPPQRFLRIGFDFEKALPLHGGGAFCCLQRCRLTRRAVCAWRGEVAEIIGEDGTDDFVLPTAETTPGEIEKRAAALRSTSERSLQSTVMVAFSPGSL